MFVQIEETPNPATLKFIPGRPVMEDATAYFADPEAATASPLAVRLFAVPGVREVFFGADFITVAKSPDREWGLLKPAILGVITEHFSAGRLVMQDASPEHAVVPGDEEDDEIVSQIKELLDQRVRPAVAMDGGDIVFRGFDKGVVYLHMQGACAGCPSSTATLKMGIENMLRHYIPEVVEVRAVV
jgi:Fe-S cluster biogenesis protein NfuA